MSKKTDTWMPLYIGDYLADTSRLSTEQHGAYLLILMDYWRNGPPPDDATVLASIARLPADRWRKHAAMLRQFFDVRDGKWHQKRADAERDGAANLSRQRASAGREGANRRWQTNGKCHGKPITSAMADGVATDSQTTWQNDAPSPSPTVPSEPVSGLRPSEGLRPSVDSPSATRRGLRLVESPKTGLPPCPHQALIALYVKHLPNHRKPLRWDGKRCNWMRSQWMQCSRASAFGDGYATEADGLVFWERFFEYVASVPKLAHGIRNGTDGRVWKPDLPWLVNPDNFLKVIEGTYE